MADILSTQIFNAINYYYYEQLLFIWLYLPCVAVGQLVGLGGRHPMNVPHVSDISVLALQLAEADFALDGLAFVQMLNVTLLLRERHKADHAPGTLWMWTLESVAEVLVFLVQVFGEVSKIVELLQVLEFAAFRTRKLSTFLLLCLLPQPSVLEFCHTAMRRQVGMRRSGQERVLSRRRRSGRKRPVRGCEFGGCEFGGFMICRRLVGRLGLHGVPLCSSVMVNDVGATASCISRVNSFRRRLNRPRTVGGITAVAAAVIAGCITVSICIGEAFDPGHKIAQNRRQRRQSRRRSRGRGRRINSI